MRIVICGVVGFVILAIACAIVLTVMIGIVWVARKIQRGAPRTSAIVGRLFDRGLSITIGVLALALAVIISFQIGEGACHTFHFFGH